MLQHDWRALLSPVEFCLSEDAYRQVKGRLDLAVSDLGPTQLKNIADPIRVYSLEVGKPAQAKPALSASAREKASRPRLSLVVLPFSNIGSDPEQEFFVDGVTECLTTDISRISGALVIARNTAFTYRGKPVDVKVIGRELNVRYVLEGSRLTDAGEGGKRMDANDFIIRRMTKDELVLALDWAADEGWKSWPVRRRELPRRRPRRLLARRARRRTYRIGLRCALRHGVRLLGFLYRQARLSGTGLRPPTLAGRD